MKQNFELSFIRLYLGLRLCLRVHKGMEMNGMYLSKGKEWDGIK